ncbi:twitching motility protein PilT, partial [Klebsiella pneumoniae]|nr:twitching motility protein PilT [Klebsiella pneumoniae]
MDVRGFLFFSVLNFLNASDLHLCNSAAPRWRRQGRLEPAPFPAPDIANLLNDWLDAAQLLHW